MENSPRAAAVLMIVPRFPGSCRLFRQIIRSDKSSLLQLGFS